MDDLLIFPGKGEATGEVKSDHQQRNSRLLRPYGIRIAFAMI